MQVKTWTAFCLPIFWGFKMVFLMFSSTTRKSIIWQSTFCSVMKLCLTVCDPTDCSTPGFPVLHYLPEFVQTHVHRAGDIVQPSHPLLPPSPPAFNLSQHPDLFQWVSSSGGQSIGASGFSISPSKKYSGMISFRIDWLDLFGQQGDQTSQSMDSYKIMAIFLVFVLEVFRGFSSASFHGP